MGMYGRDWYSDSRHGSLLTRCDHCGHSFTRTNWDLHRHNPAQVTCTVHRCHQKAVGHHRSSGALQLLCSDHLVERLRRGDEVTFVDGRACEMCGGHGTVHGQEVGPELGGQWVRCPRCFETGYDPTLRPPPARPQVQIPPQRRQPPANVQPQRTDRPQMPSWDTLLREAQAKAPPPTPTPTPPPTPTPTPPAPPTDPAGSPAQQVLLRSYNRGLLYDRLKFALLATVTTLAGAVVGALWITPLLPDPAASWVAALQQQVSRVFGR